MSELGINLGLAMLIMFSISPQSFFSLEGLSKIWDDVLYSFVLCLGLGYGNGTLNCILDKHYSWIDFPVKRLIYNVVVLLLYSFLFSLITVYVFINIRFREEASGLTLSEYISFTYMPLAIAAVITIFITSRGFLMGWRQSVIEAEQLKRAQIASQYESLKNQINPHFLFNSLNALTNLVYEDQDQAARFIRKLSEIYRYVLDTQDKEVISLREEVAFVHSCIFLHQIRFEDNLRVDIQLAEDENLMIPPLSLQMLVENAIKHNEISGEQPLHICIKSTDGQIEVTNNLQRKRQGENSLGLGLQNIKARYEHLSGSPIEITEDQKSFTVKLPLLKFSAT
ncbi:sensor histidine kinase YesM [Catalinimonas alkaloidigena]|uniref:sensor histidine kinase n=1 Tax=Catalinimonas alkaloidigena TaxID=1075417 RepID=UPI0024058E13|nr:histidine kinase [Catalinimonas alkaloidigena]MDF9798767.1 sensor histidine kinase YesM [Catalinimonas alkaloidigena]